MSNLLARDKAQDIKIGSGYGLDATKKQSHRSPTDDQKSAPTASPMLVMV